MSSDLDVLMLPVQDQVLIIYRDSVTNSMGQTLSRETDSHSGN